IRAMWIYVGAVLIFAAAGLVILLTSPRTRFQSWRTISFLFSMLVVAAIAILIQRKGWGYHYAVLIPGLIPLCAIGSVTLLRTISPKIEHLFKLRRYIV